MANHTLTDVKGIGATTAARLTALGIDSIETLEAAPSELIATLPGFSVNRADAIKAAARKLGRAGRRLSRGTAAEPKSAAEVERQKPGTKAESAARKKPGKAKKNRDRKKDAKAKKKSGKKSAKKSAKKKSAKKSDTKKTGKKKKAKK